MHGLLRCLFSSLPTLPSEMLTENVGPGYANKLALFYRTFFREKGLTSIDEYYAIRSSLMTLELWLLRLVAFQPTLQHPHPVRCFRLFLLSVFWHEEGDEVILNFWKHEKLLTKPSKKQVFVTSGLHKSKKFVKLKIGKSLFQPLNWLMSPIWPVIFGDS